MPDGGGDFICRAIESLKDIDAQAWDICARTHNGRGNPFVSHAFLSALEQSGSATPQTGWAGRHLVLEDPGGEVLACLPLYLKSHSYGEYVFDHAIAQAYERAGGCYYPKLQSSIPFTPVSGPRLLFSPAVRNDPQLQNTLIRALVETAARSGVSSLHVTFAGKEDCALLENHGFLLRSGLQFHWTNDGYKTFDDFLGGLSSRKRKAIVRERRHVSQGNFNISHLRGADIREAHWDAFYDFYMDTSERKWGEAYLTRDFFSRIGQTMGDRVLLMLAKDGTSDANADTSDYIAGALHLLGDDALYGRYWGCRSELADHLRFLHFELCYYQAIDYAIAHGLQTVEAGAQGPHKIQRGYLPTPTWSAHWFADPRFAEAVSGYFDHERAVMTGERAALMRLSPFRKGAEP